MVCSSAIQRVTKLAACAMVGIVLAARGAAANPNPKEASAADPSADAWAFYRRGYDAIAAGDWQGAYALLNQAWRLKKAGEIAGLLGQVERKLCRLQQPTTPCEKHVDAAQHFTFALRNLQGSPREKEDSRARLEKWLAEAKAQIGTLQIDGPAGAEILVDGESVGIAPLADDIFVQPGQHKVEAREQGVVIADVTTNTASGEVRRIALVRAALSNKGQQENVGVEPRAPQSGESKHRAGRNMLPAYALGGVAVAGIGTAIVLTMSANSDEDDVNAYKRQIPAGSCASGPSRNSECDALADAVDSNNAKVTASRILYGVGAAAAIAGVVYTFWPQAARSEVRTAIDLGSQGGSIQVSGLF